MAFAYGIGEWRSLVVRSSLQLGLDPDDRVGLALVAVDDLPTVTAGMGAEAADDVLRVFGERIVGAVGPDGLAVAIEGDTVAAVIPGVTDRVRAEAVIADLRRALAPSYSVSSTRFRRTVSIGMSFGRSSELTSRVLVRRAELALNAARRGGGDRFSIFGEMHQHMAEAAARLQLDLGGAVGRGQLLLHFQPVIDLRSGRLIALEALIRWRHPERGLLGGQQVVGIAERAEIIDEIDEWVLREACHQSMAIHSEYPDLAFTTHVNMSPCQLARPSTEQLVADVLRQTGLRADQLAIEITELTDDFRMHSVAAFERLRQAGVSLLLDDVGSGYNSLQRIRQLPVDGLKIDGQFVTELTTNPVDAVIVAALCRLASDLKLDLVAEGVGSRGAVDALLRLGCWQAQGDWLAPAAPPAVLAGLFAAGGVSTPGTESVTNTG